MNGVMYVEVDRLFKLIIVNFDKYPVRVHKNQVVAGLLPHTTAETLGELLGIEDVTK